MKLKLFVILLTGVVGEFTELSCPEDCDCHYFRINYVTDCSESNFTGIPYDEIDLNVYILDLNGNKISEVQQFPDDIKLRRLLLAENKIQEVTYNMFAGLKYIIDLDLSSNNISRVEPEAFRDSHGLITIELQNNPLQPMDNSTFLSLRSLMYLDISGCSLTNISEYFFTETPGITKLDLSNNPLMDVDQNLFAPLSSLEDLDLSDCSLSYLDEDVFQNQQQLKILDLSQNNFIEVDWFLVVANLHRLENLNLKNSNLNHLPEDVFNNNTWLRILNLANNPLNDLDISKTLGKNLKNLEFLDLSKCNLKGDLRDEFEEAQKLKILFLSGNTLPVDDLRMALSPLSKLTKLSLSHCNLTQLPSNTFHNFLVLQELDISHNPLSDAFIHLLQPLASLEFLDMSYSNLSEISRPTFSKMTSLKRLILSGNPLGELEEGLFGNLDHLSVLEIDNCGLEKAPHENVFYNNRSSYNLVELKMSNNPLKIENRTLLPKQLSNLNILHLSNCSISYLPNYAFLNTRNITQLVLSNNLIDSKFMNTTKFLAVLNKIEYLDLSSNKLTYLSTKIVKPSLSDIKLTNNPWVCDCSLGQWVNWALNLKGDAQHLIGYTLKIDDMSKTSKKKKGLECRVDPEITPPLKPRNSTKARLRTSDKYPTKTWSRYLREAECEISKVQIDDVEMNFNTSEFNDDNPRYFPDPILPSPQPIDEIVSDKYIDTVDDFQLSGIQTNGVLENGQVNHSFIVSVATVSFILAFISISLVVFFFTRKKKSFHVHHIPLD